MAGDDSQHCDLCGGTDARPVLSSARLDGPLVQCRSCGLYYVAAPAASFVFSGTDSQRTTELNDLVDELGIIRRDVDDAEDRWRLRAGHERLERVRRYVPSGTLLDVGCSKGFFLRAASSHFEAVGVDPDPPTTEQARAAGLRVHTGTVADVQAPSAGFDAVTMFHVIEHLSSPRETLLQIRERIRPGGVLVIETPTVDTLWFRLAPERWRQLLPDHYYFFSRDTLSRLLRECGFTPVEYRKVGRRTSLRFAMDRFRRAGLPLAGPLAGLVSRLGADERTIYVNPGDIMTVSALASPLS